MFDKRFLFLIALLIFFTLAENSNALRMRQPIGFKLPWTAEQIIELNDSLKQLQEIQAGRYELDIATSAKTNERNGVVWVVQTGGVVALQFKAIDHVYTFTPDGY
jgi:hypothetical protein